MATTVRFERKGFYTGSNYWGWFNGDFHAFPTEGEYHEFLKEMEQEANAHAERANELAQKLKSNMIRKGAIPA